MRAALVVWLRSAELERGAHRIGRRSDTRQPFVKDERSLTIRFIAVSLVFAVMSFAFSASAQNLFSNPGFDTDLSGWTTANGDVSWQPLDVNGSPDSGSARILFDGSPSGEPLLFQCIPVIAPETYSFGAKARTLGADAEEVMPILGVEWYDGPDCTGVVLSPCM